MVVRPVAVTVKALTLALYLIHPFYQDCDPPPYSVELLAIATIMVLCGINCYSVKAVARLQDWFTIAKVLALLTVILTWWISAHFRNLPLAFLISMIIVTVVYVLYNIALYVVLSPDEIILHPAAS
ncbi:hypothetical protein COOONC_22280, partial [Cooperia oncophora]